MQLIKLALPALITLAGCAGTTTSNAPAGPVKVPAKITTVCALYERALTTTKAASLPAPLDIVIGCPGRTSLKSQMSRRERADAVRSALSAPLPVAARSSDIGRRLYQRMISRGVPVEIAERMTTTSEFKRALAARQIQQPL